MQALPISSASSRATISIFARSRCLLRQTARPRDPIAGNGSWLEPGFYRLRDALVLNARFQGALRDSLAPAGIADAEDMRVRRSVDTIKNRCNFPNQKGHVGILVACPDGHASLFSAGKDPKHASIPYLDGNV